MIVLLNAAVFGLIPVPLMPRGSWRKYEMPGAPFSAENTAHRTGRWDWSQRSLHSVISEVEQPGLLPSEK
jgi:hypothetical protein